VDKQTMATSVVRSVSGEHAQGCLNLGRRALCLVSDIFPEAAASFAVTVMIS
jgi:hypothetical protein